ncbi:MAG TPA: N,N-dimethylformamidase beta subunit family domain-containing protein [Solirubrobacteraceae bacterium]|nr:N,N-dimethylformamidase beta subunit family domain-containing protein [Solirubrobacteraceae bacterium]
MAVVLAALLLLAWLLIDPRTPDLAAQVYRVGLYERIGFAVFDEHWYAGHALPGYSLLFAPLASLLGMRALAAVAVLVSVLLFERLALDAYGRRLGVRLGACLFALAAVGDVWSGRLTFAFGVAFALACALALSRRRLLVAAVLAGVCAAASPVAGLLLALAGLTYAFARRSSRILAAVLLPVALVLAALQLLFGEGGFEPYPASSVAATVLVASVFLWALPRGERLLRLGTVVYLLACMLALAIRTPMGSNIERYAVLLAGPLLLCALGRDRRRADAVRGGGGAGADWGRDGTGSKGGGASDSAQSPGTAREGGRGRAREGRPSAAMPSRAVVGAALCVIVTWIAWGPVRETLAVSGSAATSASYYAPAERFLAAHGATLERVEVPFTRSHWEAAFLAPRISLARGWEKQLDERYDSSLLAHGLTPAGYHAWLRARAVAYVALPDTPLDPSSAEEGALIRRGLAYLRPVFSSEHWRIYAVRDATPLLQGPGRLTSLGHDAFALDARAPGTFLVRIDYTRYFTLTAGDGCVASAPGGWTYVRARAAGPIAVAARFSIGRALELGGSCPASGGPASGSLGAADLGGAGYRWVAPNQSGPVSTTAENRLPGTSAWRLPGPADLLGGEAHGAIAGYVAEQAIAAGETQRVYVRAPGARTVVAQVFRMGWYGGKGGRLELQSAPLPVRAQPPCAHSSTTGLTECGWRATLSFAIPSWLASGVYVVKLSASDGAQSDCLFVVRSAHPSPLLVEIPTATYEAYNAWGGDSLYPGGRLPVGVTGTDQGVEVSYDRPYESQTGAGQFFIREVAIVRFLERYGYPVSYTTIESLDREPDQTAGARALIDVGHSEYWSARAEQAFADARDRGTSLLFLSSDTMAWRVRFAPASAASSQAGEPDHVIVAYKEHAAADPDSAQPTGLFPGGGASLVGSAYDGCITPRLQQPGPPVYRYYAWRPDPGLQPGWLFASSGVTAATGIPGIVGYELDQRTPSTPPGTRLIGAGAPAPCEATNEPSPARGSVAETTLYRAPSGALVFATGTLGWEYALSPVPQASPDAPRAPDPRVVAMTRNLLAHVLGEGAPGG